MSDSVYNQHIMSKSFTSYISQRLSTHNTLTSKQQKYNRIQCNIKYQYYLKQIEVRTYRTRMWIKSICIQNDANSSIECNTGCNWRDVSSNFLMWFGSLLWSLIPIFNTLFLRRHLLNKWTCRSNFLRLL